LFLEARSRFDHVSIQEDRGRKMGQSLNVQFELREAADARTSSLWHLLEKVSRTKLEVLLYLAIRRLG